MHSKATGPGFKIILKIYLYMKKLWLIQQQEGCLALSFKSGKKNVFSEKSLPKPYFITSAHDQHPETNI